MRWKARVLMDQSLAVGNADRFTLFLKVFEVRKSKKFPDGVKAKFAMVDTVSKEIRLLIDNHEPYGYHMHLKPEKGATKRIRLKALDYKLALELFRSEVERVLKNEAQ